MMLNIFKCAPHTILTVIFLHWNLPKLPSVLTTTFDWPSDFQTIQNQSWYQYSHQLHRVLQFLVCSLWLVIQYCSQVPSSSLPPGTWWDCTTWSLLVGCVPMANDLWARIINICYFWAIAFNCWSGNIPKLLYFWKDNWKCWRDGGCAVSLGSCVTTMCIATVRQ